MARATPPKDEPTKSESAADPTSFQDDAAEALVPTQSAPAEAGDPSTQEAPEDAAELAYQRAVDEFFGQLDADEQRRPGAMLFAEACLAFGLNPNVSVRPVEILPIANGARWKFTAGSDLDHVPDRVTFVTAGGLKIDFPMTDETVDRLKTHFRTRGIDAKGNEVDRPLPEDLTLPRTVVSGIPPKTPEPAKVPFLKKLAQDRARGAR